MKRIKIKSFNGLKDEDKIISSIDNEVMGFRVDKCDGQKYLTGESNDFYIYEGTKEIGQIDKEYFEQRLHCLCDCGFNIVAFFSNRFYKVSRILRQRCKASFKD